MKPVAKTESYADWRELQKRQRIVEIDDTSGRFVSYLDEGSGAPVVFIHGIPTWGYLWHMQIPGVAAVARALVPDMPGFGYSDKRDAFDRSIGRQTEMIVDWMDAIGVESAAIVAHDIGGGVALRMATLYPERVKKLCLMNSVCYDSFPVEVFLQVGLPENRRNFSAAAFHATLKTMLTQGFATSPPDKLIRAIVAPYETETGKTTLIRNAAGLNANLTMEIANLLPGIVVPTLIIWGEEDVFQPAKWGERLASDIPNATLVKIKDAAHFVMLDQTEKVNGLLADFLAGK